LRCVDVNILVYAHRPESQRHEAYRAWLLGAREGTEPLGLIDVVLSGFLRIVTHPRIYREPTSLATALGFVEALRVGPACLVVSPGERHWTIFTELCTSAEAVGNGIPDAFLAAIAIENGATWITADRGFSRFPGLRWQHPLDA
jgi:toxin-antitoxin system PIN domain toxin